MATSEIGLESDKKVSARIRSVDILRGLIMVLMVIDHVRVYSGLPAGGPSPGIFFTRWVTHFCAPGFVFFAGISAFLYGIKVDKKVTLANFLLTRGILLVILELTLIRFFWTFSLDYGQFLLAGVIWMLGWCMILMSVVIWFKPAVVGISGLLIIFLQSLFGKVPGIVPESFRPLFAGVWEFVYSSGYETFPGITILYVLVPWIGVMMAGYGFGTILLLERSRRNRISLWIGLSASAVFLIAACIFIAQQPQEPDAPAFIFQLLNQRKYPASPLYLLMTLGPLIALMPLAERSAGWFSRVLSIIGKVPLFFYLLHIPLIHVSAFLVNLMREGGIHQEWYLTAPYTQMPEEYRWNLAILYLVFIIDVVILYVASHWYAGVKSDHPENKWLRYI